MRTTEQHAKHPAENPTGYPARPTAVTGQPPTTHPATYPATFRAVPPTTAQPLVAPATTTLAVATPRPPSDTIIATTAPATAPTTGDPRVDWSTTADRDRPPVPLHRRDGILPTVAAALSVRGTTLTCTAGKSDRPPALHPLVQDFLDTLITAQRERFTGRCPEAVLLSRYLTTAEANRGKRASRRPLTNGEARRALKHSKITARHIREDGDPRHGTYAPPCRSCDALLAFFGVMPVGPATPTRS